MFYKLMIALLVIGGLAPFTFIKGKDGQPLMNFSDIKMPDTTLPDLSMPDLAKDSDETAVEGTVYKWKDSNGSWQFTSEPPPKGKSFSSTVYDSKMNVIQAVETKRSRQKKAKQEESDNKPMTNLSDLGSAYSPKKIKKLFDDANNMESLLNNRAKEQEKILNNL